MKHRPITSETNSPHGVNLPRPCRVLAAAILIAWPTFLWSAAPDTATFVYANGQAEWAASGDLDGNGLLDAVIVDRVTGTYRVGYQSPGGLHTWAPPRASGVTDVTSFSVGRVLDANIPALAFTSQSANRVNLVAATSAADPGVPVAVYIPSVGPNQVVAVDVGGAGDTPWHDLWIASAQNGVNPFRTTLVRNTDGASFATLADALESRRLDRGNRVRTHSALPPVVAFIVRDAQDTLRLRGFSGGNGQTILELPLLPAGSDYVTAHFAGNSLSHFLIYQPGGTNVMSHPVEEPMPGIFHWGTPSEMIFTGVISGIVTLPGIGATRLMIVFDNGQHAAVYDFDGVNPPTWVGDFFPPDGQSLLGALPMEDGSFHLLSGEGSRTTQSRQYAFDPGSGSYQLTHTDDLPDVNDLSGQANVFQFLMEPFVAAAPRLLNSLNAGDWSSQFALNGGPAQVSVIRERYLSVASGLGNPAPANLGGSHPQTQFGLANQYADFLSLFSLSPAAGNEVVEVKAQPPGGLYDSSVAVTFQLGLPLFQVQYRINESGSWNVYDGTPITLLTNTTLQYRARAVLGTVQTAIHSDQYQFSHGPDSLDSDSDGVPDYVEADLGLDPVKSGSDGDGDGHSDLEELLQGTSPTDPSDHPGQSPGYQQHATVDFIVTPRPLDGVNNVETESLPGTLVRLYDLSGSILASTNVAMPPETPLDASALFRDVFLDTRNPLLLVATEPHFDVLTDAADTRIGRELVGIIPVPDVAPVVVAYQFGAAGGVVADEADAWIAAAQAAYAAATQPTRMLSARRVDTAIAALLEHKLRSILAAHEPDPVTNLTLFPFRTLDASRPVLDEAARAILAHGDGERPAYDVRQMFHALETMVDAAPTAEVKSLVSVVDEIYRVSSLLNNDAPGTYRLPLDVLRQFLRDGALDTNFLAGGVFPPGLLADAQSGAQFLMANLTSRPVTNLTLRVRPDSFAGNCTVLETTDPGSTPFNLFDLEGRAFDFPDTFQLLPGSIVRVTGRPDASSASCGGLGLEVLSISLEAVPASSDGDMDGNLLVDSWEKLFLGLLGADPFGDSDGDGYSDLQEMFEGSDPLDGLGVPPVPMAKMQLPSLVLEPTVGGDMRLEWIWPDAYAAKVQVSVLATSDLNAIPLEQPVQPVALGGDHYSVTLPHPGTPQHFYSIALQLK